MSLTCQPLANPIIYFSNFKKAFGKILCKTKQRLPRCKAHLFRYKINAFTVFSQPVVCHQTDLSDMVIAPKYWASLGGRLDWAYRRGSSVVVLGTDSEISQVRLIGISNSQVNRDEQFITNSIMCISGQSTAINQCNAFTPIPWHLRFTVTNISNMWLNPLWCYRLCPG